MSMLLRTGDVPVRARAEYVHEVVGAVLGPLDVRAGDGNEVPDQVRTAELGALRVGELSASRPGGADRRRRHIRLLDADLCKVDVVVQGEVVVEQDGRQARLHGGDFAFVDLSRPAHWTNGWSTRMVAIAFPRRLLPLRADDLTRLTAVGVDGNAGPEAVFSSTARQLARQVDRLGPAGGARSARPRSTCSRWPWPAASAAPRAGAGGQLPAGAAAGCARRSAWPQPAQPWASRQPS